MRRCCALGRSAHGVVVLTLAILALVFAQCHGALGVSAVGNFAVIKDHLLTFAGPHTADSTGLKRRSVDDSQNGPFVMYLHTDNASFTFDLDFFRDLFVMGVPESVDARRFFKGSVRGFPESTVTLTLYDGFFEGSFSYANGTGADGLPAWHTLWMQRVASAELLAAHVNGTAVSNSTAASSDPVMVVYDEAALPELANTSGKQYGCGLTTGSPMAKRWLASDVAEMASHSHNRARGSQRDQAGRLHRRDVTLLGQTGPWSGRVCPVSVFADPLYYAVYGSNTASAMITRIALASQVFQNFYKVSLAVNNVVIAQTFNDFSWWPSSPSNIASFLSQFTSVVNKGQVPFNSSVFCLAHGFTYQSFTDNADGSQPLGLAWLQNMCNIGPPGATSGSFSVSSGKSALIDPMAVQAYTVTHEFGHSFGSDHDGVHAIDGYPLAQLGQCADGDPFIMIAYSAPYSSNGHLFSTCSRWAMENALLSLFSGATTTTKPLNTTCLLDQTLAAQLVTQSTTANYTMPWYEPENQCAKVSLDVRVPYRAGTWTMCAAYEYTTASICRLTCTDPSSGSCVTFDISSLTNAADGTVCGWNGTAYLVCLSGQCSADTYSVCDRTQPCCDAYGQYRSASYRCRNSTDPTNPCRQDDFCNPAQVGDKSQCPYAGSYPGKPCACSPSYSGTGCTGACGRNEMQGICASPASSYTTQNASLMSTWGLDVAANNGSTAGNMCGSVSCVAPMRCVMLDGAPLCQNLTVNSCELLCDNTVSNYASWGWTCSCAAGCTSNCCTDYSSFCTANAASSVLNIVPKLLAASYASAFAITMIVGTWVFFRQRKLDRIRREELKNKKSAAVIAREQYNRHKARKTGAESPGDDLPKESRGVSRSPAPPGSPGSPAANSTSTDAKSKSNGANKLRRRA